MKKTLSIILLFVALIGTIIWFIYPKNKSTKDGLVETSFRNPIPPITTGQTPLFWAKEKGYFAEEGLDVIFEQGGKEVNPVAMVAAKQNDFGMCGGPEMLLAARGRGIPIKAIAVLHRNANFPCFITLKSSGITSIQQLQGKKVGFFPGHITSDVLKPLLNQNNVDVEEINTGFDYNQLVVGNVDASWAFTLRAAIQLPQKGIELNVMKASDYGINSHGYTIFALEETIENKPELCVKLLRAIFKGIRSVKENPDEAADLIMKLNPALDRDFVEKSEAMFNAVLSDSEKYPAGYMDRSMFEEAYSYLSEEGAIRNSFDVSEAYTTKFLEEIHDRKFE